MSDPVFCRIKLTLKPLVVLMEALWAENEMKSILKIYVDFSSDEFLPHSG